MSIVFQKNLFCEIFIKTIPYICIKQRKAGNFLHKKLFLKNTVILTLTAIILRGTGIFFRIYLSGAIGSEGMGIYQLIFSVYSLMCMLCSAGFNVSVTKLVSAHKSQAIAVMQLCFRLSVFLSIALTAFFMTFSNIIAQKSIGYPDAASCVRLLSTGLLFISASACIKGYFTAIRKVSVNSNSQLFEQALRMAICFSLLSKTPHTDIYACCLAVVKANVFSEVAAFAFLYIAYRRVLKKKHLHTQSKCSLKSFFHIFAPTAISTYLSSFLHTFENLIVPDAIFRHALNKTFAISVFGIIKGMAIPIMFFPSSFLNAISTLLLPEISAMNENGGTRSIQRTLSFIIHITIGASVLIAVLFFVCAYEISEILYHENTVGYFLRRLSIAIPFMYTESVIAGTLSALDLHIASLKFNMLCSVVRIAAILTLVPLYGADAFIYIIIISNIFTSSINFIWLYRKTHFYIKFSDFFIKPVLAAVCGAIPAMIFTRYLTSVKALVLKAFLICIVYIIFLLITKAFDISRLKIIKFKRRQVV